ncbi:MAG: alpha-glucan family phosphorylase, partial [Syntrophaceae bacterium]|nr:alpha-glucan family phosphorylase [Syntrophaceae bacterium]
GKAHPADDAGKQLIRSIIQTIKKEPFRDRIVFIEDYDINVARYLVQGADVWLNTPRRPLEACGTSGMKAAANGALSLSILDGWWDEGYQTDNGWAIGSGEEYENTEYQDEIESRDLYDLLEQSVVPLFYERGIDDIPRDWISMIKRSITSVCPIFNSHRMVSDYIEQSYVPCATTSEVLKKNDFRLLKEMNAWKKQITKDWHAFKIVEVNVGDQTNVTMGHQLDISVTIDTAGHNPDEIKVEILHGPINAYEEFKVRHVTTLENFRHAQGSGAFVFSGKLTLMYSGLYGYLVRVTPYTPFLPVSESYDLLLRG